MSTNGFNNELARTDDEARTTNDLSGQVILVTEGTAGIGKATATRLAERGATVVVGRTRSKGEDAAQSSSMRPARSWTIRRSRPTTVTAF